MKISAKKAQEKTRLQSEKQALIDKKIAEEASRRKSLKTAHKKIINQISDQCLNAAIAGQKMVRLGIRPEDENHDLVEILNPEIFPFDIEEIDAEFFLFESLDQHQKNLSSTEINQLKASTRKYAVQLYDAFLELNDDPELNYAEQYLEAAIHAEVQFEDQIKALQDAYNFFDFHHSIINNELLDQINFYFTNLSDALNNCGFFKINTYDATDLEISWESFSHEDCVNAGESIDNYLTNVGLGWISSHHGQLFITAFENLIDELIDQNQTEMTLQLEKVGNKLEINLENKASIYTVLNEHGLLNFFKKLGYKTSINLSTKKVNAFEMRISWGI